MPSASRRAFAWSSASRVIMPAVAVAQGEEPGRREDPGLAHAAAEQLAGAPRAGDERRRCPRRPSRPGAERPFDRQNVTLSAGAASSAGVTPRATTALKNRAPSTWSGTPRSCAIAATARVYSTLSGRPPLWAFVFSRATRPVIGSWRSRRVAEGVDDRGGSIVPSGRSGSARIVAPDDDGVAAGLVEHGVGRRPGDRLVAAGEVRHQGDEVAHRAAGHEQPGVLAQQLGRAGLERVDRRVVAEHVVADLGRGHRAAHLRRSGG